MRELEQLADKLFPDCSYEYNIARSSWQRIVTDPTFEYKVRAIKNPPWPVPCWTGALDESIPVTKNLDYYTVISVDGSQIYPDRHNNASCFLVNIGSVILAYGTSVTNVQFNSVPHVFSSYDEDRSEMSFSADLVDCCRQEFELKTGLSLGKTVKKDRSVVLLFDGSLIFWHLASKEVAVRQKFLTVYNALLYQLYKEQIPIAGYISLPKSKELLNLIRLELCAFDTELSNLYAVVENVIDSAIVRFFLKPFERSIVFKNRSKISQEYPDCVVPHFFYLHVGTEIGRVEIPAWIANDENLVSLIACVVLDQSIKGAWLPSSIGRSTRTSSG